MNLHLCRRASAPSAVPSAGWAPGDGTSDALSAVPPASQLQGKHLAVVCGRCERSCPLEAAALALGARVTRLPVEFDAGALLEPRMARLLGRLYDAALCADIDQTTAQQLTRELGLPIFPGVVPADVQGPAGDTTSDDRRLLQTLLLRAMI